MAKISLNNIVEELATRNNLTREVADSFMHAFVETIEKGLQEDGVVKVKGLGTFKLQEMSDRGSVDVNTGERITIKGYYKVAFTPDSAMKEFVNRPFAHFEPAELNEGYPTEEETLIPETVDENDDTEIVEEVSKVVKVVEEIAEEPAAEVVADSVMEEEVSAVSDSQFDDMEATEAAAGEVVEHVVETGSDDVEQTISETEEMEHSENVMDEVSDATVEETEDVIEEAAGITTDETEELTDTTVEEAAIEIEMVTEEAADVTAEETQELQDTNDALEVIPHGEVNVTDDEVAVQEMLVELPEEPAGKSISVSEQSSEDTSQPKEEPKKRRGSGWFLVLLLIAVAVGVYYWYASDFAAEEQSYTDDVEEYDDMMVNPNLEEELGAEWGNESKVESRLPVEKEEAAASEAYADSPAGNSCDNVEQKDMISAAPETANPQSSEIAKTAVNEGFCAVTINESLQAKSIKDITPADTTDYVIGGTLVTHELKNGETIIQLAKKYYGDKRLWPYIVRYNRMEDFNHVAIGQMINIPILKDKPSEQ